MAIRSSGDEWCTRELNRPMGMRDASVLMDDTGGGTGCAVCEDGGLRPRVGVMIAAAWCGDGLMTLIMGLLPRSSRGLPPSLVPPPTLLPPPIDDGPVPPVCCCSICCCCADDGGGGLVDTLLLRSLPDVADSAAAFDESMIMSPDACSVTLSYHALHTTTTSSRVCGAVRITTRIITLGLCAGVRQELENRKYNYR